MIETFWLLRIFINTFNQHLSCFPRFSHFYLSFRFPLIFGVFVSERRQFIVQNRVISLKIMDICLWVQFMKNWRFSFVVPENQENFSHFLMVHVAFFRIVFFFIVIHSKAYIFLSTKLNYLWCDLKNHHFKAKHSVKKGKKALNFFHW